jgi:hypothetical protein
MQLIGEYQYVYGAGCSPNRKIEFYQKNNEIIAKIQAKTMGKWKYIPNQELDENNIIREGVFYRK